MEGEKSVEIEGGFVLILTDEEFSLVTQGLWSLWNEGQSTEEGRAAEALLDRLTD